MSAAIHNYVVADATTSTASTFDTVKQGVISFGNKIGATVQWAASSLKDLIMRIIEAVKPFIATVANFVQEQAAKAKEFMLANKEVSIAVGIAAPIIIMVTLGLLYMFCGKEAAKP